MKKNKFLKILKAPEKISEKELHSLADLVKNYPYSQALHILIAKGSRIFSSVDSEKKLNHAAVYATDRKKLKEIIENTQSSISIEVSSDNTATAEAVNEHSATYNNESLKVEIESYLEKLRSEKLNLQFQSEKGVSEEIILEKEQHIHDLDVKIQEAEAKMVKLGLADDPVNIDENTKEEKKLEENTSDRNEDLYNEIEENLKSLNNYRQSETKATDEQNKDDPTDDQKIEAQEEKNSEVIKTFSNNIEKERMQEYLASLKASPEEQTAANEKLKEQIKIINQFIENEPKLSRLEKEDNQAEKRVDLSLRSLKVHQNMASENLALIMAKQGKLEKAEEIYNKLILKYPEKKAYFAAQIEDLKRN